MIILIFIILFQNSIYFLIDYSSYDLFILFFILKSKLSRICITKTFFDYKNIVHNSMLRLKKFKN